jgi:hypothetical protein
MTQPRTIALCAAAIAIALSIAQDVEPGLAVYHTWYYACIIALALIVMLPYAGRARRGADGAIGRVLLLALAGAAVVGGAGIAASLLGPDTAIVDGTPGTVVPMPSLRAAGFFAAADPASIAGGSSSIVIRRRGAPEITVGPGEHRLLGESMLSLVPARAAYVDAYDAHGAHLTLTQPADTGFLSPVLLFHEHQQIGANEIPLDTFATPALHRVFRALAFTPEELAKFRHTTPAPGDRTTRVVITAADDAERPLGIVMAAATGPTTIAGVTLHVTVGTYPSLQVAAVPPLWALIVGTLAFLAGIVWAGRIARSDDVTASRSEPEPAPAA